MRKLIKTFKGGKPKPTQSETKKKFLGSTTLGKALSKIFWKSPKINRQKNKKKSIKSTKVKKAQMLQEAMVTEQMEKKLNAEILNTKNQGVQNLNATPTRKAFISTLAEQQEQKQVNKFVSQVISINLNPIPKHGSNPNTQKLPNAQNLPKKINGEAQNLPNKINGEAQTVNIKNTTKNNIKKNEGQLQPIIKPLEPANVIEPGNVKKPETVIKPENVEQIKNQSNEAKFFSPNNITKAFAEENAAKLLREAEEKKILEEVNQAGNERVKKEAEEEKVKQEIEQKRIETERVNANTKLKIKPSLSKRSNYGTKQTYVKDTIAYLKAQNETSLTKNEKEMLNYIKNTEGEFGANSKQMFNYIINGKKRTATSNQNAKLEAVLRENQTVTQPVNQPVGQTVVENPSNELQVLTTGQNRNIPVNNNSYSKFIELGKLPISNTSHYSDLVFVNPQNKSNQSIQITQPNQPNQPNKANQPNKDNQPNQPNQPNKPTNLNTEGEYVELFAISPNQSTNQSTNQSNTKKIKHPFTKIGPNTSTSQLTKNQKRQAKNEKRKEHIANITAEINKTTEFQKLLNIERAKTNATSTNNETKFISNKLISLQKIKKQIETSTKKKNKIKDTGISI